MLSFDYRSIPLNVIPSPPDPRDYKITRLIPQDKILTSFPDSFEILYPHEIKNQGAIGACTWHSYSYCREPIEEKQTGAYTRLSPASGYANRLDTDYQGVGELPREGLNILKTFGIADWSAFPVNKEYPAVKADFLANKDSIIKSAYPHRITAYAAVSTVDEIKNALMQLGPVTICIPVYSSFYNITKQNPVCPIPDTAKETLSGYHMVSIFGWRADGTWIDYNSWGEEWGDNGKFYLPFNFQIVEAYSMTDNVLPITHDYKVMVAFSAPTANDGSYDNAVISTLDGEIAVSNQAVAIEIHRSGQVYTPGCMTDSNGVAIVKIISTTEEDVVINVTWIAPDGKTYTAKAEAIWQKPSPDPKPEPDPIPTPKKLWHVQVGAFGVKENADALASELKAKGYSVFEVQYSSVVD